MVLQDTFLSGQKVYADGALQKTQNTVTTSVF